MWECCVGGLLRLVSFSLFFESSFGGALRGGSYELALVWKGSSKRRDCVPLLALSSMEGAIGNHAVECLVCGWW